MGQPIVLADFQRRFILDVYDNPHGTSMAILSMARKNGKTGLIACILLAHLVGPEARQNSQIISGAMSREQAGIVFDLACKIIRLNPKLLDIIHIIDSGKRLIGTPLQVQYRALSAEAKTAHGLSPLLAILDEVGQVVGPQSDFVDAITTAQGAHENPLLIVISTQAARDADLLSVWIDDALASDDPGVVCHLYTADQAHAIDSREAWEQSNPALGLFRSLPDIENLAARAVRMPSSESSFRNLNLNQRVSSVSPFVSSSVWKACGDDPAPMGEVELFGGLDLSAKTDLTALVLVGRDSDGVVHVYPFFWTPEDGLYDRAKRDRMPYDVWVDQGYLRTTPGATVDYSFIVDELTDILADVDLSTIAFDRWRIDLFKKEMDRVGLELPMNPFGQGFKDMAPALDTLEADLLNARIRHGMHPVLTSCAASAVVTKDAAGNRKLDKHKATGRIDGMVALAMAVGSAGSVEAEQDYDDYIDNMIMVGI